MENLYSIPEACQALAIDQSTLYRWLARAGMKTAVDPMDKRRRTVTEAQLQHLAQQHRATIAMQPRPRERTLEQRVKRLEKRVDALEKRMGEDEETPPA